MNKKNLLSGRERELQEMAERYEKAKLNQQSIYLDAEDLADLADWYSVRQKRDMAHEVASYGLTLHPENISLLIEQAYLYLDDNNLEAAQQIANQLDSTQTDTKILQAQIYILNNERPKAISLLDTIDEQDDVDTMINVAYMYINVGLPQEALTWLKSGIERYSDDEPFLSVLGDVYYGTKQYDKAIEIYNKLIDKNPYSAFYWFGLARCYFDQQMYNKAIEACDYATISDEDFPDAYLMKGYAFFYLQNDEKALECFKKAGDLGIVSQCFIDTLNGLAKSAEKKWEEALSYLQLALDEYEDDIIISRAMLYANIAVCYRRMNQTQLSDQYWKKAHETDPEDADVHLLEGRMWLEERRYDKGHLCWEKALQYAPYALTWNEIGMACIENLYLEEGKEAFEKAKEMEPDFFQINEKLATTYLLLRDKENFLKYNRLCEHPLTIDGLIEIQKLLSQEGKESLEQAIKNIFSALR